MYFTHRILLFIAVLYMGKVAVRAANEGSSSGSSSSSGGEIDTECVFEYTSTLISQGEVVSPNYPSSYPNNLNCRYEFYARENERVIIQVEDFELEPAQNTAMQEINFMDFIETVTRPSTNQRPQPQQANEVQQPDNASERDDSSLNKQCFYDFLDVFSSDGIGHLYWMARYCGRDIQTQIVSTSPTLILVFKTDRMLAFRGFKLRFHFSYLNILPFVTDSDRCGHAEISGNGSVLHSPNYPRAYPPEHIECAWTITVDKSKKILVKFIDVNFGSESCSQSYVSIWDGYVSDVHKPQFTVCQKLVYYHKGVMKFESKSNRIVIKFVGNRYLGNQNQDEDLFWSNGSRKIENIDEIKTGFLFSWTAVNVEEECSPNDFQCEGGEYCIDSKNFLCQQTQRYCVSRSLVCDGVFNCDIGDESDEKNCEMNYLRSKHYLFAVSISFTLFLLLTIVYCMIRFWRRKCLDENNKFMEAKKMENGGEFNLLNGMPEPHFVKFSKNSLPLNETTGVTTLAEATTSSSTTIQSENEQDDEKSIGRRRAPTPIRTPSKHEAKPSNTRKAIDAKDDEDEDEEDEDDEDNVDEDLENEVALIRREYRVKQLIEQNVMGNPAKPTTPKKPQLYHQHSLQINHLQQNHSHHHQPQRNSIAFTRQSTTPTYSSSLQSDNNSLSSPGAPLVPRSHQPTPPLSHHHTHHHRHHPLHHQSSLQSPSRSATANQDTDVIIINGGTPLKKQTTPSRFSAIAEKNKLHLVDESNNSLRRNSYTKAIFYENEERI